MINEKRRCISLATIKKLICNECNGTMQVDVDNNIISCPYCGSSSLVIESDDVKIEKIQLEKEKEKASLEKEKVKNEKLSLLACLGLLIGWPIIFFSTWSTW